MLYAHTLPPPAHSPYPAEHFDVLDSHVLVAWESPAQDAVALPVPVSAEVPAPPPIPPASVTLAAAADRATRTAVWQWGTCTAVEALAAGIVGFGPPSSATCAASLGLFNAVFAVAAALAAATLLLLASMRGMRSAAWVPVLLAPPLLLVLVGGTSTAASLSVGGVGAAACAASLLLPTAAILGCVWAAAVTSAMLGARAMAARGRVKAAEDAEAEAERARASLVTVCPVRRERILTARAPAPPPAPRTTSGHSDVSMAAGAGKGTTARLGSSRSVRWAPPEPGAVKGVSEEEVEVGPQAPVLTTPGWTDRTGDPTPGPPTAGPESSKAPRRASLFPAFLRLPSRVAAPAAAPKPRRASVIATALAALRGRRASAPPVPAAAPREHVVALPPARPRAGSLPTVMPSSARSHFSKWGIVVHVAEGESPATRGALPHTKSRLALALTLAALPCYPPVNPFQGMDEVAGLGSISSRGGKPSFYGAVHRPGGKPPRRVADIFGEPQTQQP